MLTWYETMLKIWITPLFSPIINLETSSGCQATDITADLQKTLNKVVVRIRNIWIQNFLKFGFWMVRFSNGHSYSSDYLKNQFRLAFICPMCTQWQALLLRCYIKSIVVGNHGYDDNYLTLCVSISSGKLWNGIKSGHSSDKRNGTSKVI